VAETNREFGRVLEVVEAAEMLDLVDTPKRQVVLDPAGQRFLKAGHEERKAIWREQLLRLRLFRMVAEVLRRAPDHAIDRDFVLERLARHLPHENYERIFSTFIRWARFGNLFAYDEHAEKITLQ